MGKGLQKVLPAPPPTTIPPRARPHESFDVKLMASRWLETMRY